MKTSQEDLTVRRRIMNINQEDSTVRRKTIKISQEDSMVIRKTTKIDQKDSGVGPFKKKTILQKFETFLPRGIFTCERKIFLLQNHNSSLCILSPSLVTALLCSTTTKGGASDEAYLPT